MCIRDRGWNYLIRLYRPRPEIADGSWQAPDLVRRRDRDAELPRPAEPVEATDAAAEQADTTDAATDVAGDGGSDEKQIDAPEGTAPESTERQSTDPGASDVGPEEPYSEH